jgi:hypothetical protein
MSDGLFQLIIIGGPLAAFVLAELVWVILEKFTDQGAEQRGFDVIADPPDPPPDEPAPY